MTAVLTTILMAPAATPVPDMTIPPFPKDMSKTGKVAWVVMDRNITRLSPTRVTGLWTADPWAERPEPRLVCREQPRCMTIVRPVPTWENTRPARAAPYASMRNVRVCGMPPAVRRIVRIIVTSAADSS